MKLELNKFSIIGLCGALLIAIGEFLPFSVIKLQDHNVYENYIDCYNGKFVLVIVLLIIIVMFIMQLRHTAEKIISIASIAHSAILLVALVLAYDAMYGCIKSSAKAYEVAAKVGPGFYLCAIGLIVLAIGVFFERKRLIEESA